MTVIVNIIAAGRQSGKTDLIEVLTTKLSQHHNLWTVKHISTSFDTAEKDTWRHLRAGAKGVVAVTQEEIITIKRGLNPSLERAVADIPDNIHLILVEGFKTSNYPKIVVGRKMDYIKDVITRASHVFAIYGGAIVEGEGNTVEGIPILTLKSLLSILEKMILTDIVEKLPRLNCKRCGFSSCTALAKEIGKNRADFDRCTVISESKVSLSVDGKPIYLSSFPHEFIRHTVFGLVRSLKGIDENKMAHVHLDIRV
ncbi:molybdopterin-guanine dinucleotide biosynthesis protein B [Candidatus Bathyarchaeota archaeon]|nr:molybdopterin-guanine dinucleotide biosynthesis protein B [Candidatus Bathyarchaeota archaeon]